MLQRPAEYFIEISTYLHRNAWSIVFLVLGWFILKSSVLDPYYAKYRADKSYREATEPLRVSRLREDMIRVRQAQQEEAARRAKEAAEEMEKKKREEVKKKRVKQPIEEKGGSGRRLNEEGGGYNPMNPSSGHSRGFRANRRNPRRGG